jgi:hypothetical protein
MGFLSSSAFCPDAKPGLSRAGNAFKNICPQIASADSETTQTKTLQSSRMSPVARAKPSPASPTAPARDKVNVNVLCPVISRGEWPIGISRACPGGIVG